jgi:hypothetical protein
MEQRLEQPVTIGIYAPIPADPTSYYRAWGPFQELAKKDRNLRLQPLTDFSWKELKSLDIVFMQRPWLEAHLKLSVEATKSGKRLWCDWDDNVLALRPDNLQFDSYKNCFEAVKQLAQRSTAVTVSTNNLLRVFREFQKNTLVVPNAADVNWYSSIELAQKVDNTRPVVMWRGSPSHRENLRAYAPAILDLATRHPEIFWVFQGMDPWFITQELPSNSFSVLGWEQVPDCFIKQISVCPDLVFVCLKDTPFDRSRSSVGWLEGTMAAANVLAPDWEEWRKPGILTYKAEDLKSFSEKFEQWLTSPKAVTESLFDSALQACLGEYSLDAVNNKRVQLINSMMNGAQVTRIPAMLRSITQLPPDMPAGLQPAAPAL